MGNLQVMPISEMMQMAKIFAESGMFADAKQMAQAFVKIQAGQEIGIAPFAAMSGIHIIQGVPKIGAGIVAAKVKGHEKYDYKIVEFNDTVCSIDFYQGKEKLGNSKFTIADAQKAATKNLDKFPRNMLFARAISNGLRWYCPDVLNGKIEICEEPSEEEIQDVTFEDVTHPPIPTLNQKQLDKLLKSDVSTVEGHLDAIEEGKLQVTDLQHQNIKTYYEILKSETV